jgi:hypothetical protein
MTNKKVSIGDLLYDVHFYGIVEGYLNQDRKVYKTTWFYFDREAYDVGFPYGEADVLSYRDNFVRLSTRMPR